MKQIFFYQNVKGKAFLSDGYSLLGAVGSVCWSARTTEPNCSTMKKTQFIILYECSPLK